MSIFQAAVLGVHLLSAHVPAHGDQNNLNLGAYVRGESGWEVGGYYNTYKRPTVYVAKHFPLIAGVSVVVGGATGYDRACSAKTPTDIFGGWTRTCTGSWNGPIAPLAGVSWAPDGPSAPRVWFTPGIGGKASSVIHLSWEWK